MAMTIIITLLLPNENKLSKNVLLTKDNGLEHNIKKTILFDAIKKWVLFFLQSIQ